MTTPNDLTLEKLNAQAIRDESRERKQNEKELRAEIKSVVDKFNDFTTELPNIVQSAITQAIGHVAHDRSDKNASSSSANFFARLRESNEDRWKMAAIGIGVTLILTLIGGTWERISNHSKEGYHQKAGQNIAELQAEIRGVINEQSSIKDSIENFKVERQQTDDNTSEISRIKGFQQAMRETNQNKVFNEILIAIRDLKEDTQGE